MFWLDKMTGLLLGCWWWREVVVVAGDIVGVGAVVVGCVEFGEGLRRGCCRWFVGGCVAAVVGSRSRSARRGGLGRVGSCKGFRVRSFGLG